MPSEEGQNSSPEKIRIIPVNWIRIPWFVNTSVNSFGVNRRTLGKNATGGFIITIERLRPGSQIALERWSRYS